MAYVNILSSEVDAKSPIDVALMSNKIKNDFDDHETRILALEAGGGSGGSSDPKTDPRYGSILSGCLTNEAIYTKKRYAIPQVKLYANESNGLVEGFDPDGIDDSRWSGLEELVQVGNDNSQVAEYKKTATTVPPGKSVSFKVKKGENFFGIGNTLSSGTSDAVTVLIDGQSVTTLALTNENNIARADDYSTVASNTVYQHVEWFFGLDGNEHIIRVVNNATNSGSHYFNFIECGYRSKPGTFAVDTDLIVSAGKVSVRGVSADIDEATLAVGASSGYGHTAALVSDTAGTLSIVNGVEPAMTHALPEQTITFSGSVTQLKARNTFYFPTKGFLLVSNPFGLHTICSYTSKTESNPADNSFNNVIWQSQPSIDFTPLKNFQSTTTGDATGDLMINLWAAGGIEITSSNNKLDFKVTINGTQTTHAATIPNGLYSADLVPLGKAIIDAMKAVKPLTYGEYFCEYNRMSGRWAIGIKGTEMEELQLLFATGSNAASSIRTAIGFSATDLAGFNSYLGNNEVMSMAHKVFKPAADFWDASNPRIRYSWGSASPGSSPIREDIQNRLGFGYTRFNTGGTDGLFTRIYPDADATGLSFSFVPSEAGSILFCSIDYGQFYYPLTTEREASISANRGDIVTGFVSFPRGTHVVTIWQAVNTAYEASADTHSYYFLGARQWFTKPREEALNSSQSILKCFDIAPKQLFKTAYAVQYSPQASKDNIDTISETGSWTSSSDTTFNYATRYTNALNDFVDITFTLQGNGGGISVMGCIQNGYCKKVGMYLKAGATGSTTGTLVGIHSHEQAMPVLTEYESFQYLGLAAGQYTLRMKHLDSSGSNTLHYSGIVVYDTVEPDVGQTVSDVTNTGQAVTFPAYTVKYPLGIDSEQYVPIWLFRAGINEGIAPFDYSSGNFNRDTNDENSFAKTSNDYYYFVYLVQTSDFVRFMAFCKSMHTMDYAFNANTIDVLPSIDGVNHANSLSQRVQTKGGSSPHLTRYSTWPLFSDHFRRYASGTMSNSTTFLMSNTRGFKVGDTVIISANSQPTVKRIVSTVNAGTSVVVTKAVPNFGNYTVAANAQIKSYGWHSFKGTVNDANGYFLTALCYEPLDIAPSKHETRRLADSKIGEVASITFEAVADAASLFLPYFSDGRQATWRECSVSILKMTDASATYDLVNIHGPLLTVTLSAGTMDIKITATRGS